MSRHQAALSHLNTSQDLVGIADFLRLEAARIIDPSRRAGLGQFFTPAETAQRMAAMFTPKAGHLRLLDAGAGVGSLTAAFVAAALKWEQLPNSIHITCFEIDTTLAQYLRTTLEACKSAGESSGVRIGWQIVSRDFVSAAVGALRDEVLNRHPSIGFDFAIQNPPYGKIRSNSEMRRLLRMAGIETSNIYTGFMALTIPLLAT